MNSWLNSCWTREKGGQTQEPNSSLGGWGGKGNRVCRNTCWLKPATSVKLHYHHHADAMKTPRGENTVSDVVFIKKGNKDLGDVWRAMMSYRPTHYIVGSPAPHRVYRLFEWIRIAQGWNDFKHQLSIKSTKQLKSLKSLRTHENPNPVHFLCLTSAAFFFS